jgi:Coenzyme PQQ synthesis protein D (PqqD)
MKKRVENQLPRARQEHLVMQDLPDELLIYDLERHRAYCLNRTAALVWQSCDGKQTVEEMARVLEKKIAHPVNEHLVWFALEQLSRYRLLEEQIELPILGERMTRREMARRLGFATAALVPFITAIVAPTAAQAATCAALGIPCLTNGRCCSKLCMNGVCVCIANQSPCNPSQPEQCCSGRCGSANQKCLP